MGAKNDASGPTGGEARVVIGVEVGEEVGDGETASETESVDGETGFGDEFGLRERGRNGRERKRERWRRLLLLIERLEGGEEEVGGVQD